MRCDLATEDDDLKVLRRVDLNRSKLQDAVILKRLSD